MSKKSGPEKYLHTEQTHNMTDPELLVPMIMDMFKPASVCDVGCGIGNFLDVFKSCGVKKVLGYDGAWADKTLIAKHLKDDEFALIDFEQKLPAIPQKFDVVINLEVAEHVSHEKSVQLIDFLTQLSDTVVFSAAIPNQGGRNHVNEQWEGYWEERFSKKGYKKYDVFRYKIRNDKRISWWYRQNMVVYSKNDLTHLPAIDYSNCISDELFMVKVNLVKKLNQQLQGGILTRAIRKIILKK